MSTVMPSDRSTPPTPTAGGRAVKESMPQWPVEVFIARVGRFPARMGKFLDRLARMPPPISWIVRMFSTVWVGITFLILTGAYIAVGSGFASLRARLEMTDLQFFDAWPMVTLLLLLATSLIVVTLRKIPLTLYKLGVWTVHIGILVMLTGCFVYFSQKVEGLTRIFLGKSVDSFYDATERALYITRMDPANPEKAAGPEIMVPLKTLPFFNEYLAVNPWDNSPGTPLHIEIPPESLAADEKLKGVGLTVTGYYPFAEIANDVMSGPATMPAVNPAVRVSAGPMSQWLIGDKPTKRIAMTETLSVEYLAHPTKDRIAALSAPFIGARGIVVRIPKLNIERTYAAPKDVPISIEGSPYTLTPREFDDSLPMVSAGYKDGPGDALTVDVDRKDADATFHFQRRAIFFYPECSPDFIVEAGKSKRVQDRVDQDIDMTFIDAAKEHLWIIEKEDGTFILIHRKPGGAVEVKPLKLNDVIVEHPGLLLTFAECTPHAVARPVAHWIQESARPMSITAAEVIQYSVIEMNVSAGSWSVTDFPVPFIEYADTQTSLRKLQPTTIIVPGVGPVRLVLSTTRHPLPSTLTLTQFDLVKYAGATNMVEDYKSTVRVVDLKTNAEKTVEAHLNSPAEDNGLYLFQARWDGDDKATPDKRYTELGVGNRPGITTMMVGSILMVLGILYSFYVKPLLLAKRKAQLAAFAAKGAV